MNLANRITFARICLIPVFLLLLYLLPAGAAFTVAAIVFIIAAATDGLDGYIARSRNQITTLGKFMDPLADKLLIAAALVALVDFQLIAAWIVILILCREFIITGLRAIAADNGVVIAASKMGKFKTVSQIIAVVLLLLQNTSWFGCTFNGVLAQIFVYIALFFTVYSGVEYIINGRSFLFTSK
jgi:CDP-diacylglycerol--glycerol-3-phosphate 3-phosphatidyltransferase